jgi:hypothetical protein
MRKFKSVEILRPFVRDSGFPLDATTLFHSYADAVDYARSNPAAYASQIVAVADEDARKTNLYKVDYDPNGHYNFILSSISVGSGASAFSFSGEVDTFSVDSKEVTGVVDDESQLPGDANDGDCYLIDPTGEKLVAYHDAEGLKWKKPTELPDNPSAGDIYLVNDQNKMYVAYSHANSIEWKELSIDVHVDEVSKTQSGLMRHEAYSTLFNDTGKDALYFSRPEEQDASDYSKTPDSNRWLEIEHTSVESGKEYRIPSTGTVSYMLNSAIRVLHEHPYAEATPVAGVEYEVMKRFTPAFSIKFRRQYSGRAKSFRIACVSFMENRASYELDIPVEEMAYDAEHQEYSYDFEESKAAYSNSPSQLEYSIEIDYYTTDDEIETETAKASVTYLVKDRMSCGVTGDMTRELSSSLASEGGVLDLRYDPSEYAADGGYVTGLYFTIPSTLSVKSIEYVQQHDVQALDYFEKTSEGGYDTYSYNLPGELRFESAGEYICRLN